jgi:hypothetical protein
MIDSSFRNIPEDFNGQHCVRKLIEISFKITPIGLSYPRCEGFSSVNSHLNIKVIYDIESVSTE